MSTSLESARVAFGQSNPEATARLLKKVEGRSKLGRIAAQMFRAAKASRENGSSDWRDNAMRGMCNALESYPLLKWGWGKSKGKDVVYVELPNGLVRIQSGQRMEGPDYPGDKKGSDASGKRIRDFIDSLLTTKGSR